VLTGRRTADTVVVETKRQCDLVVCFVLVDQACAVDPIEARLIHNNIIIFLIVTLGIDVAVTYHTNGAVRLTADTPRHETHHGIHRQQTREKDSTSRHTVS